MNRYVQLIYNLTDRTEQRIAREVGQWVRKEASDNLHHHESIQTPFRRSFEEMVVISIRDKISHDIPLPIRDLNGEPTIFS